MDEYEIDFSELDEEIESALNDLDEADRSRTQDARKRARQNGMRWRVIYAGLLTYQEAFCFVTDDVIEEANEALNLILKSNADAIKRR